MFKEMVDNVREGHPLIHNITNYVTVNDCANILLACGGSPIMADDEEEVEEITTICTGLNINIGTLNRNTIPSMFKAGKKANELNHPVVLDPVGAGASKLRTKTAKDLVENIKFDVIKGNMSEIKALFKGEINTKGVDVDKNDVVNEENLPEMVDFIKEIALKYHTIIAVTGKIDIISDGKTAYCIYNGDAIMESITGAGCQLSALMSAYVSANKDNILLGAAASVALMGVCGEKARDRMTESDGNASFRNYLIDAIYNTTGEELEKMAKYEVR